jgi:hypothetical protein
MKPHMLFCLACCAAACIGCHSLDETPIGKGVKTYEKYSDEIGKKKDVKVLGKDVVVEPEANDKIRFNF